MAGMGMRPGIIILREGTDTSQVYTSIVCRRRQRSTKPSC